MKSTQSEDLSKDLLGNLRISPQTGGFHDELDEKNRKQKELTRYRSKSDLCSDLSVYSERSISQKNTICSDSWTNRDCVKGNLSKCHTDTQTKQMK